jgi:RNA polymerase sigma-70 factor, ECF subfamily
MCSFPHAALSCFASIKAAIESHEILQRSELIGAIIGTNIQDNRRGSKMGATSSTSTFDLVQRFRGGDDAAFSQLFAKYKPRLAVLVRYKLSNALRDRFEVDDILQEVFLEASRDIRSFTYRSPGSFMSWLSRIADHVIADEARMWARQKRDGGEQVRFRSESNPLGPDPVDPATPSRILLQNERAERLYTLLEALPPDYRAAILMAKIECLSTDEMAQRLGRSREAASVLLCRALRRLRANREGEI